MNRRMMVGAVGLGLAAGAAGASLSAPASALEASDAALGEAWRTARRFVATSAGDIAYVDRGRGEAALFLHGFPLNGFQWRHAVERLSPIRRCIVPDALGLGFTRVAKGQGVAPAQQVAMLAELLDRLKVATVDIVASDSGGAVAQLFAVAYPDRVRTVLLTNCDAEPDSPPPALQPVLDMAREGKFADAWLAPWAADKTLARSKQGLGGQCYSLPGHPTDTAIDTYLGPLVASPARKALVNAYALGLTPNPLAGIEAKLRVLQVPTRIVWGMKDDIFDPRMPDYLDRLLPRSRGVRRVEAGKLFWPEEYPDILAEEAKGLWNGPA